MSDYEDNRNSSSIDQTAAVSAVREEASQTTDKPTHISSNKFYSSKSICCQYEAVRVSKSSVRVSESCNDSKSNTQQLSAASLSKEETFESTE